jgi:putative membrane protein
MRIVWTAVFMMVLVWSGIAPKDFMTWCLEVFPAVVGGVVLWFTRQRFPLTPMLYVLILHLCGSTDRRVVPRRV